MFEVNVGKMGGGGGGGTILLNKVSVMFSDKVCFLLSVFGTVCSLIFITPF